MPTGATGTGAYPILNMGGMGASGLIGSLTRLQQGDLGGLPDMPTEVRDWLSNAPASATSNLPVPPRNVLQALKQTSLAQQFGQMDTVTLDIVAMLFDQIFGDPRVPPAMKALIGRLQIPMLKVAVLDKTFFSRKTHPARRMLDMLGELSLGLGDSFGLDNPLYRRIETSLTQLVEQFEEDFGVFDRMTEEYESMIAELNGQAVAVAKVEEKRIQDRERLEVARLFAQNELRTRIAGHQLPKAVLRFLSTDWMKLLILAYAKGGRESRAWHSLLETLDILVWSLTPKYTVDERKRLVSLLPGLLKRLAKGMEVVGTDSFMRERFNAVLMRCHSRTIAGGSAVGNSPPSRTNIPRPRPTAPIPVPTAGTAIVPDIDVATPSVSGPIPPSPVPEISSPAADAPREHEAPVDFVLDRTITPGLPSSVPFDLVAPTPPAEASASQPIEPLATDDRLPPVESPMAIEPGAPLVPSFGAGGAGPDGMTVEEVSFDGGAPIEMHDITAPMPEGPAAPLPIVVPPVSEPAILQTGGAGPLQEEMLPAEVPASFPTVTVKNPFGDGDIEVEEVSFNDLPGFASPMSTHVPLPPPDEYVARVNAMKEGDWVEIHQEGKETVQARLSLVSPYRSTFVFSSRKGQKVAEYSLYQVTSYLRSGRLVLLEDVPLFDRAFGNLVNILRKGAESAA